MVMLFLFFGKIETPRYFERSILSVFLNFIVWLWRKAGILIFMPFIQSKQNSAMQCKYGGGDKKSVSGLMIDGPFVLMAVKVGGKVTRQ